MRASLGTVGSFGTTQRPQRPMRTMSSRLYRRLHSSEPGPTFGFAFYPIFGVPEPWSHITYMSALKYYRKNKCRGGRPKRLTVLDTIVQRSSKPSSLITTTWLLLMVLPSSPKSWLITLCWLLGTPVCFPICKCRRERIYAISASKPDPVWSDMFSPYTRHRHRSLQARLENVKGQSSYGMLAVGS